MQSDDEVLIKGDIEKVFDLITQVRFWPKWHLATRAVSGVIERPFKPGDIFYEFVRTINGAHEIEWHVAEYNRPHQASIQLKNSPLKISYTFRQTEQGTIFRRELVKSNEVGIKVAGDDTAEQAIEKQSVANLVSLVEGILQREKYGPDFC